MRQVRWWLIVSYHHQTTTLHPKWLVALIAPHLMKISKWPSIFLLAGVDVCFPTNPENGRDENIQFSVIYRLYSLRLSFWAFGTSTRWFLPLSPLLKKQLRDVVTSRFLIRVYFSWDELFSEFGETAANWNLKGAIMSAEYWDPRMPVPAGTSVASSVAYWQSKRNRNANHTLPTILGADRFICFWRERHTGVPYRKASSSRPSWASRNAGGPYLHGTHARMFFSESCHWAWKWGYSNFPLNFLLVFVAFRGLVPSASCEIEVPIPRFFP